MKLYAGIDLHSTNCVIVVVDEAGSIVRRSRLKNRLELIAAWLEPFRDSLVGVVVESTYNWYWLVDGLAEQICQDRYVRTVTTFRGSADTELVEKVVTVPTFRPDFSRD